MKSPMILADCFPWSDPKQGVLEEVIIAMVNQQRKIDKAYINSLCLYLK